MSTDIFWIKSILNRHLFETWYNKGNESIKLLLERGNHSERIASSWRARGRSLQNLRAKGIRITDTRRSSSFLFSGESWTSKRWSIAIYCLSFKYESSNCLQIISKFWLMRGCLEIMFVRYHDLFWFHGHECEKQNVVLSADVDTSPRSSS